MNRKNWPLRIFGVFAVIFLLVPTLIIIPMSFSSGRTLKFPPPGYSFRWYENLFTSPLWTDAAVSSIQIGILAAILATVLGTIAALGLTRGEFPAKGLVQALVLSPIIIPLVIVAIGMFSVFVRWRIAGSLIALVIAHTVLAIPFVVVNVMASLRTLDRNLELAAANLGANPVRAFRFITLPLIAPGVMAGALFAFITSWDEIVVAIFLTSPILRTLPVVMWGQIRTEVDPTIAAAATILTVITTIVFTVTTILQTRGNKTA
ncbi:MAG: putative spermidine/putrescine transport system permease protein [Cellvibrionaceae bacterium]|jgi:putative spermidine/putrescine transport system permease protein